MTKPATPPSKPEPRYLDPPAWLYTDEELKQWRQKREQHQGDDLGGTEKADQCPSEATFWLDMPCIVCRWTPPPVSLKRGLAKSFQRFTALFSRKPNP